MEVKATGLEGVPGEGVPEILEDKGISSPAANDPGPNVFYDFQFHTGRNDLPPQSPVPTTARVLRYPLHLSQLKVKVQT